MSDDKDKKEEKKEEKNKGQCMGWLDCIFNKKLIAFILVIVLTSIGFFNYNLELEYTSGNIYDKSFQLLVGIIKGLGNAIVDILNYLTSTFGIYLGPDFWSMVFFLIVIVIIIKYITSE